MATYNGKKCQLQCIFLSFSLLFSITASSYPNGHVLHLFFKSVDNLSFSLWFIYDFFIYDFLVPRLDFSFLICVHQVDKNQFYYEHTWNKYEVNCATFIKGFIKGVAMVMQKKSGQHTFNQSNANNTFHNSLWLSFIF